MAEPSTRTVERALALLATICDRGGANLADSAQGLRVLRQARRFGCCARSKPPASSRKDEFGMYRPGSRIIQLGASALSNESLIDLAEPAMEELAHRDRRVRLPQRQRARRQPRCTSASSRARIRSGTPAGSVGPCPWTRRQRDMRCAARFPTTVTSSSSVASRPTSPRSPARCTPRPESSPR